MKKGLFLLLIGLMLFTGCSAPAVPTATPTTLPATPTKKPAPTVVPPTPTPEPTPTPAPVPVPLIYKGWQDKAYSRTCVDAVISMTDQDVAGEIIPAASALLEAMGMQVVPVGEGCEALYVFALAMEAKSATYSGGGQVCEAFTGADLYGDLVLMNPENGDEGFSIPLRGKRETSQQTLSCNTAPPFGSLWPKAVIEGFSKVYGFKALEAAITVPVLQFEVSNVLQEGKYSAEQTLPVLMKSLQSDDPTLVKASLVAIAEYREKAAPAVPLLIPLLTHPDKWLATLAADDLRMIGPGAEAAIPALLLAIEDPDIQLAPQAAFALGTIGRTDEDVLSALMRHVSDADFSMAMFVQSSLERLTGEKFTKPAEWQAWWSKRPKVAP